MCYDPYPYLGGNSNDGLIIGMCVEGTKMESNIIWVYYTAKNALIKIVNRLYLIDA